MKKKAILTVFIVLVSAALIFFSKNMQRLQTLQQDSNLINQPIAVNQEKPDEVKKEAPAFEEKKGTDDTATNSSNQTTVKVEPAPKSSADTSKTTDASKTPKPQAKPEPVQAQNLVITDSVTGKIILSKAVVFSGETAAQATIKTLDAVKISYKTSTFGDAIYFSSINGIRERSAGPSSGWCYFVNGKKLSVGAGSYKLNKDDKLEWKFLKDGITN